MNEIKTIRKALRLTQQAFAARLGVSVQTIKYWEWKTHTPSAAHRDQIVTMMQNAQHERIPPVNPTPPPAAAPVPSAYPAPPTEAERTGRRVLRLGEAVRLMGLKDEGHGRRSDHTIRKAIKLQRLRAWKEPGYRPQYAEWRFFADDFEHWRAQHYQGVRDPRRNARDEG